MAKRGRPYRVGGGRSESYVTVRLSQQERARWKRLSRRAGKPLSILIRDLIAAYQIATEQR